jgi:hypothetical protein
MDNWGKGIFNNKILLRKNRFNSYEPSPQESPELINAHCDSLIVNMTFEIHEDDPYL